MNEQIKIIWCFEDKLLPLRQYNASLCRKATFDVAHPVGQWSVSLWFTLRIITNKTARFEAPMSVRATPSLRVVIKPCALANIEIGFYYTYFGVDVFIEFFLQNSPFPSAPRVLLLYSVFVVESETYCSQYQVKELEWKMFGGVNFYDVILSNPDIVPLEILVIIQSKNIPFELTNLRTSGRNIINIQPYISVLFRQIAIFQPEAMFNKLIVENGELILLLFMRKHRWLILVVPKENTNFSFTKIQQIKNKIHNSFILFKGVEVDLLPFNFFLYPKFFHEIAQISGNIIVILAFNQDSSIEIGIILTVLIALIKPNINHISFIIKTSATVSCLYKVTLRDTTSVAESNIFCESVTNHLCKVNGFK